MRGCNIPADEARLYPFTPLQHSLLCITSCSDARGNDGRCNSQQHPPYRWISRALSVDIDESRFCILHHWSQIPKHRVKLDVGKVLTAHSELEVVVEIHQHPTWLRFSSEQPIVAGQPSQLPLLYPIQHGTIHD